MKIGLREAKVATLWTAAFVGGPTVAYVATGGSLFPGWGAVPTVAFFIVWFILLTFQSVRAEQRTFIADVAQAYQGKQK